MRTLRTKRALAAFLSVLTFGASDAFILQGASLHRAHLALQNPNTSSEIARLSSQLKSASEEERRDAAIQLSLIESDEAIKALSAAVADASARVRAAAVAGLGERADEAAVPLLASRLAEDKSDFVRRTAAYALSKFRSAQRTSTLLAALKDKNAEVRAAAAVALGDHPDAGSVAALASALSDKSAFVRAQAARALGVNGHSAAQAVPALVMRLTKDDDQEVKRQAAAALGRIGDPSALPALEKAKRDKDPYLVEAANEAIAVISRKK